MKEITIFSYGDSNKLSTWSNVPYLFTKTLENKGLVVNRVNILPNRYINLLFNYSISPLLRLIDRKSSFDYSRSFLYIREAKFKIEKAVNRYPNSDAFVFLNFDFSVSEFTSKPSFQFGDWTYEHYLNYFVSKSPNFFEKEFLKHQQTEINNSNIVSLLFPGMQSHMEEIYKSKISYIGNVINSVCDASQSEALNLKSSSSKILFVGSVKYMEGALSLIEAFTLLKKKYSDISLHFIGLNDEDFKDNLPKDVFCYGYLDKGIDSERQTYYNLFKEAKVFVNTTPKWSSFSASIEAMYFYTPVIVPSYDEFVHTFGEDFNGGLFCDDNRTLSNTIEILMHSDNYIDKCINAHELVKEFTWDRYIDKFLNEIRKI